MFQFCVEEYKTCMFIRDMHMGSERISISRVTQLLSYCVKCSPNNQIEIDLYDCKLRGRKEREYIRN